ncbi:MAG: ISAzo13 family transposase [Victivallaceae bacterium]|nr:ISAzo13 family transposase [Victivallaceae bacterium]
MEKLNIIKVKYEQIKGTLNERSRRIWAASEAMIIGHGGITIIMKATKLSRNAINHGISDIKNGETANKDGRIRRKGAGRKKLENLDDGLVNALDALVSPETRGDPESPLRWTTKSTRKLSSALNEKEFSVSHEKVSQLLKALGYSLQAPGKTNEGKSHPDRDSQFNYINSQTEIFQNQGLPVISIDAKKKELIGAFANGGQEYQPSYSSVRVNVYDFPSFAKGKVTPYGIYDITQNTGWVNVGVSKDTAQFAVATIKNWWNEMGVKLYPGSAKLLVHADGGGSNGSRNRLWKAELQKFSTESGLEITVSHFPPGTSKWNKIEHRLFSQITKNWRGKPLESLEVVVSLIGATSTEAGLKVHASVDPNQYEGGIKISDKELKDINIKRHEFHGNDWNYTILPKK